MFGKRFHRSWEVTKGIEPLKENLEKFRWRKSHSLIGHATNVDGGFFPDLVCFSLFLPLSLSSEKHFLIARTSRKKMMFAVPSNFDKGIFFSSAFRDPHTFPTELARKSAQLCNVFLAPPPATAWRHNNFGNNTPLEMSLPLLAVVASRRFLLAPHEEEREDLWLCVVAGKEKK